MNPRIPAGYAEVGRWLQNFATSHAKREHPRVEAIVEAGDEREGRSYGLRLVLDGATRPEAGAAPLDLDYAEVADGRTRFAWCEALAQRLRAEARELVAAARGSRSA